MRTDSETSWKSAEKIDQPDELTDQRTGDLTDARIVEVIGQLRNSEADGRAEQI